MKKRVAISTGGDAPGFNMCLKNLVFRVIEIIDGEPTRNEFVGGAEWIGF